MSRCMLCNKGYQSYSLFVRHMVRKHGVDSVSLWRRIDQAQGGEVWATLSERGRWYVFLQGALDM